MSQVVQLRTLTRRPRVFTTQERFIEELREIVRTSRQTQTQIAAAAGVSSSTIHNLASGKTQWPRHTTLFSVLKVMNKKLAIVD